MRVLTRGICWVLGLCACRAPASPDVHSDKRSIEALTLSPASAELYSLELEVSTKPDPRLGVSSCAFQIAARTFETAARGGSFQARIPLAPGSNQVTAHCKTPSGKLLSSAPETYQVKIKSGPRASAQLEVRDGRVHLSGARSQHNPRSSAPLTRFVWKRRTGLSGAAVELGQNREETAPLPLDGVTTYQLTVTDANGTSDSASLGLYVKGSQVKSCDEVSTQLELFSDSVVYGALPPVFGSPPLASVTARLPALAELGVNVLWLAPIAQNKPGDFGYAVEDYFQLRSDYGTSDDLKNLVATAHRLGLRVVLDLVPNHTSATHRYFKEAQALGQRSHYFDFYQRDPGGEPKHYFDWEHLPNLNYENVEVQRFMTEAALHWLREFDVDGYRVDAVWGIRQRKPDFIKPWLEQLERARPCLWMLAEAPAHDPFYAEQGFDFAYDWGPELGHWAFEEVFAKTEGIAERLSRILRAAVEKGSYASHRVVRFLNNNDTGSRFVARHGLPLTHVATTALFTLPGIPALYSFDEIGAEFEPYSSLRPVSEPGHAELLSLHKQLIALRRSRLELQSGELDLLPIAPGSDLLVFMRRTENRAALVALNFGANKALYDLDQKTLSRLFEQTAPGGPPLPSAEAAKPKLELMDALHPGRRRVQATRPQLQLEAFDYAVFVPSSAGR